MTKVEEYFEQVGATPSQVAQYERVLGIVKTMVPEVEETVSYGIPTLKYKGKFVIYFLAGKNHMAVYPALGKVEPTKGTKGTFRFTEEEPVPEWVVKEIVSTRLKQIA